MESPERKEARRRCRQAEAVARVLPGPFGWLARVIPLRKHLKLAGITRAELFERTKHRRPIRVHDLRATFVTVALAEGHSEAWICDRTGHRSSQMVNAYRRAARIAVELGLGPLRVPGRRAVRRPGRLPRTEPDCLPAVAAASHEPDFLRS